MKGEWAQAMGLVCVWDQGVCVWGYVGPEYEGLGYMDRECMRLEYVGPRYVWLGYVGAGCVCVCVKLAAFMELQVWPQ